MFHLEEYTCFQLAFYILCPAAIVQPEVNYHKIESELLLLFKKKKQKHTHHRIRMSSLSN